MPSHAALTGRQPGQPSPAVRRFGRVTLELACEDRKGAGTEQPHPGAPGQPGPEPALPPGCAGPGGLTGSPGQAMIPLSCSSPARDRWRCPPAHQAPRACGDDLAAGRPGRPCRPRPPGRSQGRALRGPARQPWHPAEMPIADPDGTPIALVEVPTDHPLRLIPSAAIRDDLMAVMTKRDSVNEPHALRNADSAHIMSSFPWQCWEYISSGSAYRGLGEDSRRGPRSGGSPRGHGC